MENGLTMVLVQTHNILALVNAVESESMFIEVAQCSPVIMNKKVLILDDKDSVWKGREATLSFKCMILQKIKPFVVLDSPPLLLPSWKSIAPKL